MNYERICTIEDICHEIRNGNMSVHDVDDDLREDVEEHLEYLSMYDLELSLIFGD